MTRYNLNVLEEWVRTNKLNSSDDITASVQPVVQASQLLQMNKQTQAHAQAICGTCTRLTSLQVKQHMYSNIVENINDNNSL